MYWACKWNGGIAKAELILGLIVDEINEHYVLTIVRNDGFVLNHHF
jgi:hypothetical protein